MIRRVALAASVVPLLIVAMPRPSSAAPSLALPRSDYPHGARIAALPATNALADQLLGPAHRSPFEALHRVDGVGWLQAAKWHFKTGRGAAHWDHLTIFGYGINVFHNGRQARRALSDVKIKTRSYRVAHLPALIFRSSDAGETLVFVFFVYQSVEVEAYYEFKGPAPAALARALRHLFSRQSSHLAHYARVLNRAMHQPPTPVPTTTPALVPSPTATAISTATATPTVLPSPTATPRPSATPTAPARTPTPSPTEQATPTVTPTAPVVQATMASPTYPPGALATLNVRVTLGGQPVSGATVMARFLYPSNTVTCTATTDQSGAAICQHLVPAAPDGTQIYVTVNVTVPNAQPASTSTTFTVKRSS